MNDKGSILAVLIIIICIISITSMAAFGTLDREIKKVNKDYFEMVAHFAAESGVELAKKDIFTGKKSGYSQSSYPKKMEFEYGNEFFPEASGRIINCNVIAYVYPDKVFFESNARVFNKNDANVRSRIISERTFKKLITVKGSPPKLSTIWRVCN